MNEAKISYRTVQLFVTFIGSWLIIAGGVGYLNSIGSTVENKPKTYSNSQNLKVEVSSQQPSSTINNLQGAGNLQSQGLSDLQNSSVTDQLQPNAKTDNFSTTKSVQ